jgi:hypothetical protein
MICSSLPLRRANTRLSPLWQEESEARLTPPRPLHVRERPRLRRGKRLGGEEKGGNGGAQSSPFGGLDTPAARRTKGLAKREDSDSGCIHNEMSLHMRWPLTMIIV